MAEIKQPNDVSDFVLELGGKPDQATVSLRIFGDELDPEELTQILRCQPTEAYKRGHIVTNTLRRRTVRTGQWFLNIEKNSHQTLEEQILELLEKLPEDLEIWENLHKRFEVDIYCGAWLKAWNRDVFFSTNLLKQLADRRLELAIAIYCDCNDEEVEILTKKLNEAKDK